MKSFFIVLLFAIGLAACEPAPVPTTSTTPTISPKPAFTPTPDPRPRVLRINLPARPDTLDPQRAFTSS